MLTPPVRSAPTPSPEGFRPAPPDITERVARLIPAHFPQLASARLVLAVRDSAEDAGSGKVMVAGAGANDSPGADAFEFMMWVAWDVWQLLDEGDREALLYHELAHFTRDETGKPTIKPHDAGVFDEEITRYGAWWVDAQQRYKARRDARKGESSN